MSAVWTDALAAIMRGEQDRDNEMAEDESDTAMIDEPWGEDLKDDD